MADESFDGVAVLDGGAEEGLRWVVSVDAVEGHLMVMLNLVREGQYVSGSGFDGSKHFGGVVLQTWRGRTDDLPWHVMARVGTSVTRVVVTTNLGTEVELALSPFMPEYGSKFAAASIPEGEFPRAIRAERDGVVVDAGPQPSWESAPEAGG